MMKTIMMCGVHRVELVDLYKPEAFHVRPFPAVDSILSEKPLKIGCSPMFENTPHPFDKVFGCSSRGQGDYSAGILQDPFDEAQCNQFTKQREIIDFQNSDSFRWSMD